MLRNFDKAVQIQRQYYTDTALPYDAVHAHKAGDDYGNLIPALCREAGQAVAATIARSGADFPVLGELPGLFTG